jgi:Zn-dependent alcohol dehydrogenase
VTNVNSEISPSRCAERQVHGCGGVGLSAVMIAAARGAQIIAVDISPTALELARTLGATATLDPGHAPTL